MVVGATDRRRPKDMPIKVRQRGRVEIGSGNVAGEVWFAIVEVIFAKKISETFCYVNQDNPRRANFKFFDEIRDLKLALHTREIGVPNDEVGREILRAVIIRARGL